MSAGGTAEDAAYIRGIAKDVVVVEHDVKKTAGRRLASIFTIWPFGVLLYRSAPFARALEDLLRRERFDVIIGGNINMAQYTAEVELTPKVIAPVDAISLYYRRQMAAAPGPAAFLYSLLQYWKVRRYERVTYSRYDACVLVAKRDAEVIRELCPGLPIYFAPSGADIPPFVEVTREPRTIAFSGVMNYPPNVDAAEYFAEEIFPLVRAQVPDAVFHIVGKDPTPEITALARRPGVVVTGLVPDVKDYLRRMEVYVCPMRQGAGMKMKIVEALAVALPVVTTTLGAEGMDLLVAGRDLIVADEPEKYAAAVVRLLGDEGLRQEYGRQGRQAVERSYTWEANAAAWEEVVRSVAARRRY